MTRAAQFPIQPSVFPAMAEKLPAARRLNRESIAFLRKLPLLHIGLNVPRSRVVPMGAKPCAKAVEQRLPRFHAARELLLWNISIRAMKQILAVNSIIDKKVGESHDRGQKNHERCEISVGLKG